MTKYFENGNIKSEIKDGVERTYYETGELETEVAIVDGFMEGMQNWYYKSGQLESEFYIHGNKPWEQNYIEHEYSENGDIEVIRPYVNSKLEGKVVYYHSNGQAQSELLYKEGTQIGMENVYYPSGMLEIEIPVNDGIQKQYYESGELEAEYTIVDNKKNGLAKAFYKNGQLEWYATYKNDIAHGISKSYHENGNLKLETFIDAESQSEYDENGTLIKSYSVTFEP